MTSNRFLLDSDILIEHLRGRQKARSYIAELRLEGELLVSTITIAELFTGVRDERDEMAVDDVLQLARVVPVDEIIARRGGVIRRQYSQSHGTGVPDALIAATVELTRATLVTFNKRHFPMVADLIVPYERP